MAAPETVDGWPNEAELFREIVNFRQVMTEALSELRTTNALTRERLTMLENSMERRISKVEAAVQETNSRLESVQKRVWALPKAATVISGVSATVALITLLFKL